MERVIYIKHLIDNLEIILCIKV